MVIVLQVCIDDSGRGQDPVFVLAGYVARVRNWEAFSDEWHTLLSRSRLACLKAKEVMSGEPSSAKDKCLLEFVSLIRKYTISSIKIAINRSSFNRVLKSQQAVRKNRWFLKNPYETALTGIMAGFLSFVEFKASREKIEFILDEGLIEPQKLRDIYKHVVSNTPRHVAEQVEEPRFCDDKKFLPLQAADLFAWHVRKEHHELMLGEKFESPVWRALSEIPELDFSIDEEELRGVRNRTLARLLRRS